VSIVKAFRVVLLALAAATLRAQASSRVDSLTVVVRSNDGHPLSTAHVLQIPRDPQFTARTNDEGVAVLPYARGSGRLRVRVIALGYEPREVDIRSDTGPTVASITMRRTKVDLRAVCTTNLVPAIRITLDTVGLADSVQVTATVRAGAYRAAHEFSRSDRLFTVGFASERPGTYSVSVSAPGYTTWKRSGVSITKGVCHVNSRSFVVRLEPASRGAV
jgi:hypothetical protein